jgi:hypothetical protein
MNRRKAITLLSAVLPCAFVARMLGEKDLHGTPSPYPVQPYTSGFHVEVYELAERYDMEGNKLPPCFRAIIRDCKTNYVAALNSAEWVDGVKDKRIALQGLYRSVAYVLQRRQFPADTKIYDVEKTEHGLKWVNPRYHNE